VPTVLNLVQLGNTSTTPNTALRVTNASIKDSHFLTLPTDLFVEGLDLTNVSGVLVENCLIEVFSSCVVVDLDLDLSGIHLSSSLKAGLFGIAQNCKIVNCIFAGSPQDSVYADQGSLNIEISNCLIGNAVKNGILYNVATGSIRNNTIQFGFNPTASAPGVNGIHLSDTEGVTVDNNIISSNSGNGILIDSITIGSMINVVRNNVVSANNINGIALVTAINGNLVVNNQAIGSLANGILVGAGAFSNTIESNQVVSNVTGIHLEATSNSNLVQNNQVSISAVVGIQDDNTPITNSYFDNTSVGNGTFNYSAGIPAQVPQGNPALAGQNVEP
jgi:parallel beta-helix repeat protein